MEELETPHSDYLKGFNEGYILTTSHKDLSDKLISALSDSQRSKGFKDGREQFLLEKRKDRLPSWLNENRLNTFKTELDINKELPNKEMDLDKDK